MHIFLLLLVFLGISLGNEESEDEVHFTNSWAVHIEAGDLEVVNEIAKKHGFINQGQIGSLPGYYNFKHAAVRRRGRRSVSNHSESLLSEPKVKWVEQQRILERSKRHIIPGEDEILRDSDTADYVARDRAVVIKDPHFKDQWYLQNLGQSSGPMGVDINVLPAWARGYSGKGIVLSILDDGVDHHHPDLKRNYDPDASFDFNSFDSDPMPDYRNPENCHGTKCAGEVAAEANNGICGVGVAYNSSIGGIRMLDGHATDTIEGSSLSYHSEYIDIYSCCWGPKDDGKRFGKPGLLASKALKIGAERGRGGKGNIFVWATGNGGLTDDDCNCDGYTTSIYTVSVGAISDHGLSTYYTETCSSTLAVTFSGGSHRKTDENKIVTTDLHYKCTGVFKGTSSAAPLAAGMIALVLEANPRLSWRDVQHIVVETSQMTSRLDEGWKVNGAGKRFNHKFGFGRLDVGKMVEKALTWKNVGKQRTCYGASHDTKRQIPSSGSLILSANTSACRGTGSEVGRLEHVQVMMSLKHRHRGDLSITLISPSGTRSQLLRTRRNDHSAKGLRDWLFMTVHYWGEDPKGLWTLVVTDNDRNNRKHHLKKAKQADFEDASRILMDESDRGNDKYERLMTSHVTSSKAALPKSQTGAHHHILKTNEDSFGELFVGKKFKKRVSKKPAGLKKNIRKLQKTPLRRKYKNAGQRRKTKSFVLKKRLRKPVKTTKLKDKKKSFYKTKYKPKTNKITTKKFVIGKKLKPKAFLVHNKKQAGKNTTIRSKNAQLTRKEGKKEVKKHTELLRNAAGSKLFINTKKLHKGDGNSEESEKLDGENLFENGRQNEQSREGQNKDVLENVEGSMPVDNYYELMGGKASLILKHRIPTIKSPFLPKTYLSSPSKEHFVGGENSSTAKDQARERTAFVNENIEGLHASGSGEENSNMGDTFVTDRTESKNKSVREDFQEDEKDDYKEQNNGDNLDEWQNREYSEDNEEFNEELLDGIQEKQDGEDDQETFLKCEIIEGLGNPICQNLDYEDEENAVEDGDEDNLDVGTSYEEETNDETVQIENFNSRNRTTLSPEKVLRFETAVSAPNSQSNKLKYLCDNKRLHSGKRSHLRSMCTEWTQQLNTSEKEKKSANALALEYRPNKARNNVDKHNDKSTNKSTVLSNNTGTQLHLTQTSTRQSKGDGRFNNSGRNSSNIQGSAPVVSKKSVDSIVKPQIEIKTSFANSIPIDNTKILNSKSEHEPRDDIHFSSEMDVKEKYADKDLNTLEKALEEQLVHLSKSSSSHTKYDTNFLERVKQDVRNGNIRDLESLEDHFSGKQSQHVEMPNEFPLDSLEEGNYSGLIEESREPFLSDSNGSGDRLEKRRLPHSRSHKPSYKYHVFRDKYGKGNSGILESWTLILYGTN